MQSIECRVGRLIECRLTAEVTMDEVDEVRRGLFAILSRVGSQVVPVVDLRGANTFAPEVADAIVAVLRADNPKVERSAYLTDGGAVLGLQTSRILRDVANPRRRSFKTAPELEAFLGEVLGPAEQRRLRAFLGEG